MDISATAREWIVILSFLALIAVGTLSEALWIQRAGWAGHAKAISFSALTNIIGFFAGGFVLFVVLLLMFMMTFEKKMSDSLGGERGMIVLLIVGLTFGPIVMTLSKRLFLRIFRMSSGGRAWMFSLASSVAVVFVSVVVPVLVGYLLFRGR
jgi:hypothetical protein